MSSSLVIFLQRRRRLLLWLAAAFAVFSLAGFFLVPVILKQQLVKRASAALHRPVAVGVVRVNPWAFSVTIRGLAVAAHDGAEFAGWDELYVNFAPAASLFRHTWCFDEIHLLHPRGRLYRDHDGSLNIADLIPPANRAGAPAPAASLPPLAIAHLRVERGEFTYVDKSRSAPFATTFGPTTFELTGFTTRPQQAGAYTFAAATEAGETFAWKGTITFDPLGSAGHVAITGINLPKYAAFHRDLHRMDLLDGRLAFEADYDAALDPTPVARIHNGTVAVRNLKLAARDGREPAAAVSLVQLEGLSADTAKHTAAIASVVVRDATLTVERRADGSLNLLDLLPPSPVAASETRNQQPDRPSEALAKEGTQYAKPAPEWSATLAAVKLENASVHLTDLSTPRPVHLTIDQLGLTLTGVSTQLDKPVGLSSQLRWNEHGRIAFTGSVTPQPLAADLQVEATDLELRPLDPYAAPFLNVLVTSGTARAKGHLTAALPPGGSPQIQWQGDAGLAGFAAVDAALSEPFVSFTDLALSQLSFTLNPLAFSLDEIAVKDPFVRVVIAADKQINLLAALKTGVAPQSPPQVPQGPPAPPSPSAAAPKPRITIGRVVLSGARFSATDRSVLPEFTTELSDFAGTIAGLSSENLARADVDLAGKLGQASLHITGKINPLSGDAFTDVKVAFTGIELTPFTPYAGRFAGYTIAKGKLGLDLGYRLSSRMLEGENKVVLDQFFLGDRVDSADATKLPVKLALAILRDTNGRIEIDLPVRGNLDDPDFKYGQLVWKALGNVIVKAATAPFALLGGLFGGGHDLSAADFASGSAELGDEARARLDGLAKALTERPGLSLEIDSRPVPTLDETGLREVKLGTLLKARKIQSLAATTTTAIDPSTVTLSSEETVKFLAEAYVAAFPPGTEKPAADPATTTATPTATKSTAATPSKPASAERGSGGNLITRSVRRIFGRGEKSPSGPPPPAPGTITLPAGSSDSVSIIGADGQPLAVPLAEIRSKLLQKIELTDGEFREIAARRAARIQAYLVGTGKIDPSRVFLATGETPPAEASTPRVVFSLK